MKLTAIINSVEELTDLPKIVYKYRDWENNNHKSIITRRQVFFAAPKSFEDPIDCKNPLRFDLLTEQDAIQKYLTDSKRFNSGFTEDQHYSWAIEMAKNSPIKDQKNIKRMQQEMFDQFNERFGVLSLTANPSSMEMWAKYSNDHKGFCIGFNPKIMFEYLGGGGAVDYVDKLPNIYPYPKHSYEEQHFLQVFKKLKKWSFEEEYRTHKFKPEPMELEDRIIELPPEAFNSIIIGAKITTVIKRIIINSVPKELSHISIFQARLVDSKIAIDELA